MSCEDQMVRTLKESGHRPTPQRLMILSAVRHSTGHVTAPEILEQVRESYSYIDMSTVLPDAGHAQADAAGIGDAHGRGAALV